MICLYMFVSVSVYVCVSRMISLLLRNTLHTLPTTTPFFLFTAPVSSCSFATFRLWTRSGGKAPTPNGRWPTRGIWCVLNPIVDSRVFWAKSVWAVRLRALPPFLLQWCLRVGAGRCGPAAVDGGGGGGRRCFVGVHLSSSSGEGYSQDACRWTWRNLGLTPWTL